MKKLITTAAALLLFAGISFAAETKLNNQSSATNKAVTVSTASTTSFISARTLAEIIEENATLRLKVEELTNEKENLSSMLGYSNMMHATINNLHEEKLKDQQENTDAQLDYARMMTATIINLNNVIAGNQ